MSFGSVDREIHQLEARIASDRAAFVTALSDCGHSVRETVSSPTSLLAAAGIGFVAGKIIFRPRSRVKVEAALPPRTGLLGLAAAALSLMQPGFGAGGIARWAAKQMWERRKAAGQQAAPRAPTPAATPVRMPPRKLTASGSGTTKSVTPSEL